ncbi:MAG: hypothetical protein ACM3TU_00455 [Bacillota bacterium]
MHTEHRQDLVPLELIDKLDIEPQEDAARALTQALWLVEAHDVRKFVAFTAYYGLRGFIPASAHEIGTGLGISKVATIALIESVEDLVDEEIRTIRNERLFPDTYGSWPLTDFFTIGRALMNNISLASAVRIRNFARREKRDTPTVHDFCKMTENGLLLIPGTGVAMAHGIKIMLNSVHLRLATH